MTIKHILTSLSGEPGSEHLPLAALQLAKSLTAHVTAGFGDPDDPYYIVPDVTMGMVPGGYSELYQALADIRSKKATTARANFDKAVKATSVPIVTKPLCMQASTEWLDTEDGSPLAAYGAAADLIILDAPANRPGLSDWVVVEEALFGVRRPVLLVPKGHDTIDFSRPVIAWNGSLEAANAVQSMLNLCTPESRIAVLQVGSLRPRFLTSERLMDYLGWHCLASELHQAKDVAKKTGEIIAKEAKALGATVLVMGAYTHSRTREILLGGVTDYMRRFTELPILLAH